MLLHIAVVWSEGIPSGQTLKQGGSLGFYIWVLYILRFCIWLVEPLGSNKPFICFLECYLYVDNIVRCFEMTYFRKDHIVY